MSIRKTLAVTVLTLIMMSATWPVPCQAADIIRVNGSGSALDMLKPLVEAYMKTNRDARIEIGKPLGSSGAVKSLLDGALDIAASSKQLTAEDTAKGARLREYGRTPLAIVTEKHVQKSDITTRELEEIYAGRIGTWRQGERIRVVLRPQEDIDTKILRKFSPGLNSAITEAQSHPGMIVAVTDPEAYTAISTTPGGFGASGLTSIIVARLPLNILSLNGVRPAPKTLANGTYPLVKEISFVTTPKTAPAALKFLEFVYSPQGRAIADKSGVLVTAP